MGGGRGGGDGAGRGGRGRGQRLGGGGEREVSGGEAGPACSRETKSVAKWEKGNCGAFIPAHGAAPPGSAHCPKALR